MYDALLTLRGWGVAEFREFSPDLQAAARWALFAERVAPMLSEHRAAQDANLGGLPPERKLAVGAVKIEAGRSVPVLAAILYPEDTDGQ